MIELLHKLSVFCYKLLAATLTWSELCSARRIDLFKKYHFLKTGSITFSLFAKIVQFLQKMFLISLSGKMFSCEYYGNEFNVCC